MRLGSWDSRFGKIFFCIFAGSGVLLYMFLYYNVSRDNKNQVRVLANKEKAPQNKKPRKDSSNIESDYLINTGVCKLPRTKIMPSYYKRNWHTKSMPNCSYESIISDLDEEKQVLKLRPEYIGTGCCVQEILPVPKLDNSYKFSACTNVTDDTVDVNKKEIIVTKCGSKLNFEANLLDREPVRRKLEFWKTYKGVKPYSVILFGIDNVSRSHAYRSLAKSLDFMKTEMGFIDLKGYHSVGAGTIYNFMGFLAGKTVPEVRNSCARSWSSPYDPCPFIWNNFSANNYVTMYIEDGLQSFNWENTYSGGFRKRPADYYIHALFSALEKKRRKVSKPVVGRKYSHPMHGCCTSSETVPQFLFRYTQRFTKKFADVPSFSFTWFADPFHDQVTYTLRSIDKDMLQLLQFLNSSPTILKDTIIVFVGDHGDRTRSRSLDGFIERGLPPLFIRLPDRLQEDFPGNNYREMLKLNSERLTAPYDIHHTLLHMLNLPGVLDFNRTSGQPSKDSIFKLRRPDRTSLIMPVPLNRTCRNVHVHASNCVCNVNSRVNTLSNPFIIAKIRPVVGAGLNKVIRASKYKDVCAQWTINDVNWLLQAQILKNTTRYLDVLIQFEANPKRSHFETMVRVYYNPADVKTYGKAKLLGKFSRVSVYGNQSHCVALNTDFDKEMKGLCFCKKKFKKFKKVH